MDSLHHLSKNNKMYLLHSLKPRTLINVLKTGGLLPAYSKYSRRSGIWFNALPKLVNEINAIDDIWKENVMFFNRGPVLVFKRTLLEDHRFDIQTVKRCNNSIRENTSPNMMWNRIYDYYNHRKNEENDIESSRWFHSHEIVTDKFVPLNHLYRVLLYSDSHYDDLPFTSKAGLGTLDWRYIPKDSLSFEGLYSHIL